ncbi:heavy-metal-associated domain-containing protein [Halobacteriales archaeon Cl-PHB]
MTQTLTVEGMSCEGCEATVEEALESVDGVEGAEADEDSGSVRVEGDADADDLRRAVEEAGYTATA